MAAFTEGYSDVKGTGRTTQHLGAVISKVLEARQLAQEERRKASKKLWEQDSSLTLDDFGITKGYFFKKALQHEFGGDFIDEKKSGLKKLINTRRILKSKKKLQVTAMNFLRDNTRFSSVNPQRAARFRKKFDYKLDGGMTGGADVARAASGSGNTKKASKDDFLTAVVEIAKQLQTTADSINRTADKNATIASSVSSMQKNVVVEISNRTDQVTDRLEAISSAINQQTEFLRRSKEKETNTGIESAGEKQRVNTSFTNTFDVSDTKKDESLEASTSENMLGNQNRPADPWGSAEKGAIISGDKGGYDVNIGGVPIEAHGTELVKPIGQGKTAIIPLDNYATDGIQGNEVTGGGDLAAEQGIVLPKIPALPDIPAIPQAQPLPEVKTTTGTSKTQPLLDAMQLPFKAVGGGLLNITSELRARIGKINPSADAQIENIQNIISAAFKLPKAVIQKSTTKFKSQSRFLTSQKDDEEEEVTVKEKPWYKKLGEFWNNFTESANNFWKSIQGKAGNLWKWLTGKDDKKEFSKKEIASIMYKQFIEDGLSDEGARMAIAEFMRETDLQQKYVLGSHDDDGVTAVGAGSWQGGRDDNFLSSGGFDSIEDFSNSGEKGIKHNASFMIQEMKSGNHKELLELLKKQNLSQEEKVRVRDLMKNEYFVYDKSIPLSRSETKFNELNQLLEPKVTNDQQQLKSQLTGQTVNIADAFSQTTTGGVNIVHLNLGAGETLNLASTIPLENSTGRFLKGKNNSHIHEFYPQNLHEVYT